MHENQGHPFERNYIIAKEPKRDKHAASFQSSPKINRMLITNSFQLIEFVERPVLEQDIFRTFKIFPEFSPRNMHGALDFFYVVGHVAILSPVSTVSASDASDHEAPFED